MNQQEQSNQRILEHNLNNQKQLYPSKYTHKRYIPQNKNKNIEQAYKYKQNRVNSQATYDHYRCEG
jgi:hypothetical protein